LKGMNSACVVDEEDKKPDNNGFIFMTSPDKQPQKCAG